jgi:hypothetical protein
MSVICILSLDLRSGSDFETISQSLNEFQKSRPHNTTLPQTLSNYYFYTMEV